MYVFRSELTRAFKIWSDVAAITFTETTGTADINILFAVGDHGNGDPTEEPFDGPGWLFVVLLHISVQFNQVF